MMKQIQEQTALSPLHSHWRLADNRNVLYLSPTGETDTEKNGRAIAGASRAYPGNNGDYVQSADNVVDRKTGYRSTPGRP